LSGLDFLRGGDLSEDSEDRGDTFVFEVGFFGVVEVLGDLSEDLGLGFSFGLEERSR